MQDRKGTDGLSEAVKAARREAKLPLSSSVNVKLSIPLRNTLEDLAALHRITVSDLVRRAVTEYCSAAYTEFRPLLERHIKAEKGSDGNGEE